MQFFETPLRGITFFATFALIFQPSNVGAQEPVEFFLSGKTIGCFEREKERYFKIIVGDAYFYISPQSCPEEGSANEVNIGVSANLNDIIVAESIGGVSLADTDEQQEHILIYLNRQQFECATRLASSKSPIGDKLYTFNPSACTISAVQ
ncbi:hypothetical protein ACUXV3_03830 [Roseobacteraceae bacterium NS-SX3]